MLSNIHCSARVATTTAKISPVLLRYRSLHLHSINGSSIPSPENYPTQSPSTTYPQVRGGRGDSSLRRKVDLTKPYKDTMKTLLNSQLHWTPTPHITEFIYKPPVQKSTTNLEFVMLKLHPLGIPADFAKELTADGSQQQYNSFRDTGSELCYSLVHYEGTPGTLKKVKRTTVDQLLRSEYTKTLVAPFSSDLHALIDAFDQLALSTWRPRLLEKLKAIGKPLHWRNLKPSTKLIESMYTLLDSEVNNSNSELMTNDLQMSLGAHFANMASTGEIEDILALNQIYPHEMERGFERLGVLLERLVELRGHAEPIVKKDTDEWYGKEGLLEYWDEYASFVEKIEIEV